MFVSLGGIGDLVETYTEDAEHVHHECSFVQTSVAARPAMLRVILEAGDGDAVYHGVQTGLRFRRGEKLFC